MLEKLEMLSSAHIQPVSWFSFNGLSFKLGFLLADDIIGLIIGLSFLSISVLFMRFCGTTRVSHWEEGGKSKAFVCERSKQLTQNTRRCCIF